MIKQAAIIAIGMVAGPLIQVIATPWLSRLYTPTEFGYLAFFVSSLSVLATVACLRYETAIPVVGDDLVKPATQVALFSALATMLLASVVVWSGVPQALYQPFLKLGNLMWGLPIAAACGGTMLLVYYLTLRRGEFVLNAVMRSLQVIIFVALAIGFTSFGLVQVQIASWLIAGIVGLTYLIRQALPVQTKSLWATAVRFKHYPVLLTPTAFLDAVAVALPVFLIGSAYGPAATGNYSQLQRLLGAPLLLVSAVMGQMFFKYSGELFRAGKSSRQLMWWIVKIQAGIAAIVIMVLAVVGEPACKWLLGVGWRVDTLFLLLVTVPFMFRMIVSPVSTVFLTHHRVSLLAKWQVGYFITVCSTLYVASNVLKFEGFLLVYLMHELILYAVYLSMANRVASEPTI